MATTKVRLLLVSAMLLAACSSEEHGADGDDEMTMTPDAGRECAPRTCEEAAVECGPTDNGCGGTLECGDACASVETWYTCGGGGEPTVCGARCEVACPTNSMCTDDGACSFTENLGLDRSHTVTFRSLVDSVMPTDTADCTDPTTYVGAFWLANLDATVVAQAGVRCGTSWMSEPVSVPAGTYKLRAGGMPGVTDMPNQYGLRLHGTVTLGGIEPTENVRAGTDGGLGRVSRQRLLFHRRAGPVR